MTRQDIADYLGLSMETVSRTLSQLERDALIELPTARQIRMKKSHCAAEFSIVSAIPKLARAIMAIVRPVPEIALILFCLASPTTYPIVIRSQRAEESVS